MFYNIFKSIQTALKTVAGLKATQWFNMQYEATIAQSPVAFVEFPEDNPTDHASKDVTRLPFRVRIHVVTKVIAGQDGQVPDIAIQQNETLALAIKTALKTLKPAGCTPLRFSGLKTWQRMNGFMITFVDFTARIEEV